MNLVRKGEVLHRGEYLTKRIENWGHGGYLRVEVPAVDIYGKGSQWHIGFFRGIDRHVNSLAVNVELGTVEPEVFCSPHELLELWNGNREVANLDILEARGGDPATIRPLPQPLFQVSYPAIATHGVRCRFLQYSSPASHLCFIRPLYLRKHYQSSVFSFLNVSRPRPGQLNNDDCLRALVLPSGHSLRLCFIENLPSNLIIQ
jgi:hypothetical protein